jgi:hypothetical protein
LVSQDIGVLHQFEEEEMEARRHRINRMNEARKNKFTKARLLDVFGIEDLSTRRLPSELNELQYSQRLLSQHDEEVSSIKSNTVNDSIPDLDAMNYPTRSALNLSMTTHGPIDAKDLFSAQMVHDQEHKPVTKHKMTEEQLYNLHMQTYLNDTLGDIMGDLQYCDHLDFLLDDPDEIEAESQQKELRQHQQNPPCQYCEVPIFEINIDILCEERSLHLYDDFSEVTCRSNYSYVK